MSYTHDGAEPRPHSMRGETRDPNHRDPLKWLEMSFTTTGYRALSVYRQKLALERGHHVPLGVALDELIKSHPFCADKGRWRERQAQ